jgi:hypothetical protein
VAKKVKLAIRVKLDGHGRAEAEPEELVPLLEGRSGRHEAWFAGYARIRSE